MGEKITDMYESFTLLVDGKEAFPEIIKCINNAKKSISINMFIWRDDHIGNEIGKTILEAANRGVKVNISIDRYGVILEKAEENKKSFFHKEQSLIEKVKSRALEIIYPKKNTPKVKKDVYTGLYKSIMSHENISVDRHYKEDHSKYFVFDDDIVIMGGINIEDKENDQDKEWRVYQDYMIKLEGKEHVESFLHKLDTGENLGKDYYFGMNKKGLHEDVFEMEDIYLDLIRQTKKELIITMAYFSSVEKVIKEILDAHKRGVKVSIMIPRNANYQDDSNKATMEKLMKLSNDEIEVYFSPKMVHTKMIITDDFITLGSTNINKKAFKQLDELNIVLKNVECKLKDKLIKSVKENYNMSKKITTYKEIKYNKFLSKVERILI